MDPRSFGVVFFAVIPDELHIIEHLFDVVVAILFELFVDGGQVHGVLDYIKIVGQSHALPVDGLPEIVGLVRLQKAVYDYLYFL